MNESLSDWRRKTVALLHNISDAPALEAELLIEHVTGLSRTQQRLDLSRCLSQAHIIGLQQLRERRVRGEPLAYILGEAHFWTLALKVTPAVLIPRPETELVVERALSHLHDTATQALDLGTGSGAIALAIAQERQRTRMLACDVSVDALQVARANAENLHLTNVELLQSNWFDTVPALLFDVIVSNPPYIDIHDADVQPQVRAHEPHVALFAADQGMASLNMIISSAPRYLSNGGWLIMEHGWQQAAKVRSLLESSGFVSVASHLDLAGHERVTEAQFFFPEPHRDEHD